ncbi:hypothetical protein PYCC9005_004382 [Savitreella phatthalungensis]
MATSDERQALLQQSNVLFSTDLDQSSTADSNRQTAHSKSLDLPRVRPLRFLGVRWQIRVNSLSSAQTRRGKLKVAAAWTIFYIVWIGVVGGLVWFTHFWSPSLSPRSLVAMPNNILVVDSADTAPVSDDIDPDGRLAAPWSTDRSYVRPDQRHGNAEHRGSVRIGTKSVQYLACESSLWLDRNGCGIDGRDCEPFWGYELAFRCPSGCASSRLLNPRVVGDKRIVGKPLIIGGGPVARTEDERQEELGNDEIPLLYRSDSWICPAAIQAGVISDMLGGCGKLRLKGSQANYNASIAHGVESFNFPPRFPKSYVFLSGVCDDESDEASRRRQSADNSPSCIDLRWPITIVHILFTVVFAFFQANGSLLFGLLFFATFWHTALVSDPPPLRGMDLLSRGLGAFLPASFVAFAVWKLAGRETLKSPTFPPERVLLYITGLWIGVLSNYVFGAIPVSRLLISDINRDGGWAWVIGGACLILTIAVGQMVVMRKAGILGRYLMVYASMFAGLIMLAMLPSSELRIHHYIFAILFLPGTGLQTRPSMFYQSVLLGLFINGIARWGFDSIVQTIAELRGDAAIGSVVPDFLLPDDNSWIGRAGQGMLSWSSKDLPAGYAFSLLVDDVERYRGSAPFVNLTEQLLKSGAGWFATKLGEPLTSADLQTPHFARVAYCYGQRALDYSFPAVVFFANGSIF